MRLVFLCPHLIWFPLIFCEDFVSGCYTFLLLYLTDLCACYGPYTCRTILLNCVRAEWYVPRHLCTIWRIKSIIFLGRQHSHVSITTVYECCHQLVCFIHTNTFGQFNSDTVSEIPTETFLLLRAGYRENIFVKQLLYRIPSFMN